MQKPQAATLSAAFMICAKEISVSQLRLLLGSGTAFGIVVNEKVTPLFQKWQSGSKPKPMSPPFKKY